MAQVSIECVYKGIIRICKNIPQSSSTIVPLLLLLEINTCRNKTGRRSTTVRETILSDTITKREKTREHALNG